MLRREHLIYECSFSFIQKKARCDEMAKRLSKKQENWLNFYFSVSQFNATDAARRAGYKNPTHSGHENLIKLDDEISKRMQLLKEKSGSNIDSQQDLMEFFSSIRRGNEKEKVVTNSGKVVNVSVSMKDRIKAAELLGRSYGMFTDKKEINGDLKIDIGIGDYDADN
jgi:phage terminase small subunit